MQSISLIPDMLEVIACTGEGKTFSKSILTMQDLTQRYDVTNTTIYNWVKKGKFPPPKIIKNAIGKYGKKYYWEAEEIEEFEKGITNENN